MVATGVDLIFYRNVNGKTINRLSKALVERVLYANGFIIVPRVPSKVPGNSNVLAEAVGNEKAD